MAEEETKRPEEEVLFPDQEVYGIKLRPWTYDQFVSILPLLINTRRLMKERGIGTDQIESIGEDEERAMQMLEKLAPLLPVTELISKTTDIDQQVISVWEFDKAISVFLLIMIQNIGRIKNFFGLGLAALSAMRTAR